MGAQGHICEEGTSLPTHTPISHTWISHEFPCHRFPLPGPASSWEKAQLGQFSFPTQIYSWTTLSKSIFSEPHVLARKRGVMEPSGFWEACSHEFQVKSHLWTLKAKWRKSFASWSWRLPALSILLQWFVHTPMLERLLGTSEPGSCSSSLLSPGLGFSPKGLRWQGQQSAEVGRMPVILWEGSRGSGREITVF